MTETQTRVSLGRLQELLKSTWLPIVEGLHDEFDYLDIYKNTKPHVGYEGYIPFVDGGAEFWVMISSWEIIENSWFQTTIGPALQKSFWDEVNTADDAESGKDEKFFDEQLDYYDSYEAGVWLKCRCLVEELEDGSWEASFDSYLCEDNYGRDYISWLRCYGANPNQTVGDFLEVVHQNDFETEEGLVKFLRNVAQQQVDYLKQLRDGIEEKEEES
jgi:hypothetical protein